MDTDKDYPHKKETYEIIGACMEVHNELGCGFLEAVYQEALSLVFLEKNIPFDREKVLDINFKGKVLTKKYVADFVCFDKVVVELKATEGICDQNIAQVLNALKATKLKIGLLINFGTAKLQYKRIIL
jgi:GxxExxY protein